MGKVTENLYDIYVTQETSCAEAMLRAGVGSRRSEISEDCCRMMSGYSGGMTPLLDRDGKPVVTTVQR